MSGKLDLSVLLPYRAGDPARDMAAEWVQERWRELGVEVCVGVDDDGGAFSRSRALNRAFELSTCNDLMIMDCDIIPTVTAIGRAKSVLRATAWGALFDRVAYLSELGSRVIISSPSLPLPVPESYIMETPLGCMGLVAVRRRAWEMVGGFDEKFQGWGYEDTAFQTCLRTLFGSAAVAPAVPAQHLWHPRPELGEDTSRNEAYFETNYGEESIILDRFCQTGVAVC